MDATTAGGTIQTCMQKNPLIGKRLEETYMKKRVMLIEDEGVIAEGIKMFAVSRN